MDYRDKAMTFGNATSAAATIYGSVHADPDVPFDLTVFEAIRDSIFESGLEWHLQFEEEVAAQVAEAFPGATVTPIGTPAANLAAAVAPAPAPVGPAPVAGPGPAPAGPGPAPIPQANTQSSGNDALWEDLFANFNNWYDNRTDAAASCNGGNRPDFRRKSDKKGLWISGKVPTPQWARERLGVA